MTSPPPRRPGLTRARITEAAVALADAGGAEAVTMRALARSLGVEAMSLYNHVRNKDDLLDALVEAAMGEVARPAAGGDWRAEMRRRATSMRAVFLAHPWAPSLILGRITVGPNMLGFLDASLGCLRAAGFGLPQADRALTAIDSLIYGFHLRERIFPVPPEDYAEAARAHLPAIDPGLYPDFCALGEMVATGAYDGVADLAFGLDLLLEALDAQRRG